MTPSPSSTRKSKRLEKQLPVTPVKKKSECVEKRLLVTPVKKSESVEKQMMPSPLRRSERAKKQKSQSTSEMKKSAKSSGFSDMKQIDEKGEKTSKQLTSEASEVGRNRRQDLKPVQLKDARRYKALFIQQKKKDDATIPGEELKQLDKLPQCDSANSGGSGSKKVEGQGHEYMERIGENIRGDYRACERSMEGSISTCKNSEKRTLENYGGVELSNSSRKEAYLSEDLQVSRSGDISLQSSNASIGEETTHDAETVDPTSKETALGDGVHSTRGDKVITFKRKKNTGNLESDASAMVASKDICDSITEIVSLPSPKSKKSRFSDTCLTCCKKQREDYDSQKEELCSCSTKLNQDLCAPLAHKDGGEVEASYSTECAEECNQSMQRKDSSIGTQMDGNENTCVVCNLGEMPLCCDGRGCKRSYHLSCLDPPLNEVPPGIWHCPWCVKKKVESGVHSVSKGIESIWNAREVEVPSVEGLQRQKQYFVKYKGLAHIHNQWVPETQLLLEAPLLLSKFHRKNQGTTWKLEWTMPHRLLMKRLLMFPKQHDENSGEISDCRYEWLVKWSGLDYEHVTWELENASFLSSTEAQRFITGYENRREKEKKASVLSKVDKGSLIKLSILPVEGSLATDNNHLNCVNKLRQYWHKGRNAVVFGDQERVVKVILFILSLQSDICRPFLIISASSALSSWEAEFLRFAASVNVVVYSGNRDARRNIRTLEFYEEGGCIMFQVLLSPPEAIVEDLEELKCLNWEAIIIDDCLRPKISHFEQIKVLATDFWLLFFNNLIKDTTPEHLNLLSWLEPGGDVNSSDNIGKLKERLSWHIAYECKSEPSRFVEYWVPVQSSNVQLERYCATLLSNSISLCSPLKNDPVGVLRNVLISTRKCCDHPYLVDPSLQKFMTKDLQEIEYLDVGVNASGKLQLLDKMLKEIKNQGLRVLVLFQSIGGSGMDSIGDYLDDFLRQRFGPDSYERIDGVGSVPSKKQAALNRFNSKESGRFVFLLETRACLPSIKLSSVDTIIVFGSDWNPMNDLRALQRITIDSQFERIKVFRLYTVCTVEEKVLLLAKEDVTLDSNLQSIHPRTSHMLLMWGASYLFSKLDEFHGSKGPVSSAIMSSEQPLLVDAVQEFKIILLQNGEKINISNSSIILEVKQNGGTYSRNISLPGELELCSIDEELPHAFWTKLLEERHPRWKYLSVSSEGTQRIRKRVQYYDVPKKPEIESDEAVKKRKKGTHNNTDSVTVKCGPKEGKVVAGDKEGASGMLAKTGSQSLPRSTAFVNDTLHATHASTSPRLGNDISVEPKAHSVKTEERRKVRDAQKSLYFFLRPEMSRLCEILLLPDDVKGMVGRLLEYIMDNHHVNREPVTILHAFQLSLCWIAASLLKHKIDRKESLARAKQHLNFACKEEEADNVYSKLWFLKEIFLNGTGTPKRTDSPNNPESGTSDTKKDLFHPSISQSTASNLQKENLLVEERLCIQACSDKQASSPTANKAMLTTIKEIKKRCSKRMENLLRKQQDEVQVLYRICDEEKAQVEKEYRGKVSEDLFAKKLEEHKYQMDKRLQRLHASQLAARNKENDRKARWLGELKSWAEVEFLGEMSLDESVHGDEHLQTSSERMLVTGFEQFNRTGSFTDVLENVTSGNLPSPEEHIPDRTALSMVEGEVPLEMPETSYIEVVEGGLSNRENDPVASDRPNSTGVSQHDGVSESISRDTFSPVLSSSKPPSLQSVIVPAQCGLFSLNHVCQDKSSDLATSSQIQDGDTPLNESQYTSQVSHSVDGVSSGQSSHDALDMVRVVLSNHEALVAEPVVQLQLSESADLPPVSETQNTHKVSLSNLDGAVASNESNHGVSIIDPVAHAQLSPSFNIPTSGHGQPVPLANGSEHQLRYASSPNQSNLPSDCIFTSGQPYNDALVIEPVVQQQLSPSLAFLSSGHNQPDLHSTGGIEHQLQVGQTSSQNAHPSIPLVNNLVEPSNQTVSQPAAHVLMPLINTHAAGAGSGSGSQLADTRTMPVSLEFYNRRIQSASSVASRMPPPLYPDPLQNELERMRKERDQTIRFFEDQKLRLKNDCEKEIEEIVAQIRSKFESKFHNLEAEFLLKKKELDTNEKKVYMNKMLAEAFRSKCTDHKTSAAPEMQQDGPFSFAQQLVQLSLQDSSQRPFVTGQSGLASVGLQTNSPLRPPFNASPLVVPPAASLHTTAPPRSSPFVATPLVGRSAPQSTVPSRSPLAFGPSCSSAASSQSTPPSVMAVRHSSALLSSNSTRPPLISPITPLSGNRGSEIRAPAPHLQPFRPSSSLSATTLPSLSGGVPNQQTPSNPSSSSPLLRQNSTRLPVQPVHLSGPYHRAPQPESAGGPVALINSSPSAMGLSNPPNDALPPHDAGSLIKPSNPLEYGNVGSLQANSARAVTEPDVVCLSDDD